MNSILWIVFTACLAHQANADYSIEIKDIISNTDAIDVTLDDPEKGDIKITNHEERDGSRFTAQLTPSKSDSQIIEGKVCNVDDETADGLIAQILHSAVQVDDCPFPMGNLEVIKMFNIEGNGLDEFLPPGFGMATLQVSVYGPNNDGKEDDICWSINIYEIPMEEESKK